MDKAALNNRRTGEVPLVAALMATLALCAALLLMSLLFPGARLSPVLSERQVNIVGSYTVPGNGTMPMREDADFSHVGTLPVVIEGHFDQDIEENLALFMRVKHLRVALEINGEQVYSYGEPGTYPAFSKSAGNLWVSYTSPGITTDDEVRITLMSVYEGGDAVGEFVRELAYGSADIMYINMLSENGAGILVGLFIVALGVIMLIGSTVSLIWRMQGVRRMVCFAVLLISGGLWFLYDANYMYMSLLIAYPVFNNILDLICVLLLPVSVTLYLRLFTEGRARVCQDILLWLLLAATAVQAALQLTGVCDLYELQLVNMILSPVTCIVDLGCLAYEWRRGDGEAARMLISFLPLAAGAVADIAIFYLAPSPARLWVRVGFLISVAVQVVFFTLYIRDRLRTARSVQRLENELLQSRIKMMLSQIKPHFLYNSLNAISSLVLTDPQRADAAIVDFSDYLRANLSSIENDALIRFDRELTHINSYVSLEKMRYGDRLSFECDAEYTDFLVPTLSVQPLVENAICHGIAGRRQGSVRLSVRRGDGCTLVCVEDDGEGFDPAAIGDDSGSVGISNVRRRLMYLCGATMDVVSEKGRGTAVTITIPDGEEIK